MSATVLSSRSCSIVQYVVVYANPNAGGIAVNKCDPGTSYNIYIFPRERDLPCDVMAVVHLLLFNFLHLTYICPIYESEWLAQQQIM